MKSKGKFFGIGVGPGAPDLLTVRAVNILKTVDVVCIPRSSVDKDSVALKVAGTYISTNTELMEISMPMTRDKELLELEWCRGAEKILQRLNNGKNVAFITIGDSMLFSTYTYLLKRIQSLDSEIVVESVPGITSFSAAAAYLNSALAEGAERLAVIPALEKPSDLKDILKQFPNVVLMKVAGKHYEEVINILTELNLKEKAVYISKLGYPDQFFTFDLDSLRDQKRDYLSLILVKREGF